MNWLVAVLGITFALAGALFIGSLHWRLASRRLLARLRAARQAAPLSIPTAGELHSLPPPVARYLKLALGEQHLRETALPGWAALRQRGEMRLGEGPQGWKSFTALQSISARPPGFVWEARFRIAPGLSVVVRDSYVAGRGAMQGKLLGLIGIVNQQGTPQIAAAALQRWLAEAVWLPTALLPDALLASDPPAGAGPQSSNAGATQLSWIAVDDSRARAILRDSAPSGSVTEVSIEYRFNAAGEIEGIFCPARFRDVKGTPVATAWEGRFSEYRDFDGLRIPTRAEVGWHIEGEYQPYWRGEVVAANFSST